MNVKQAERVLALKRRFERLIEFPFRADLEALAAAQELGQLVIDLVRNVVERAILQEAFGGVALVVEDEHDRIEAVVDGR